MIPDGLTRFLTPGTDTDVAEAYASLASRALDATFGFEDEYAIVDIETTGFDPALDSIIEIAAAVVKGPEVVARFDTLVEPGRAIPPEITKLTGISDGDVAGAPSQEAAVAAAADFVGGRDVIAHNVAFDRAFLTGVGGEHRFPGAWIDSLQLALLALPRLSSHRLFDLAAAFGMPEPSHRATDDVDALARLWRVMLCGLAALPPELLVRLSHLAPSTEWALRPLISHLAAASGNAPAFDLKELRRARVASQRQDEMLDAEEIECACPPLEEVAAEFRERGVADRMYPGFERREEQAAMAGAVIEAFAEEMHAAIEAGTGVGKSVAYLVPAARFAMHNRIGVGVATKTNSLMDQLVYSELPALCQALGGELRYVSLKGYEHYPCLRRLDRFAAELDESGEQSVTAAAALLSWIAQTSWGDLDAVNLHWRTDVRTSIAASVADCARKRCRYYPHLCFLHGARRGASSAHIVVTNHALLFRDVVAQGGILPPLRHWIVDEAHAAESEARKQLSLGVTHVELAALLSAIGGSRGGIAESLRRLVSRHSPSGAEGILGEVAHMEEAAKTARTLVDSMFDFVKEDLGARTEQTGYDSCELRVTPELRESGTWGTIAGVGRSLSKRLEELVAAAQRLVTLLEAEGSDFTDVRADLAGLLSRVADQWIGLVTVLDGEADEYVYSVALDRRPNVSAERFSAARLDVGEALAEEFYPRTCSVVFTSATIATGDDFSHFVRSVGLDRLPEERWRTLRLASSYDFERQMAVFIPEDLDEPRSPRFLGQLEQLLEEVHLAMGGSTLTLFTNRRDMEALYHALSPRLERRGVSLLLQGRGVSRKRLRDEFLADESVSLFATKSFWEGFDAKGDTLRCVVVPRLPFGRPNDPLAEERSAREGRNAWRRYDLPEAVIELKQAAGRLIRSKTDTGCMVLADVRVLRQSYGREFLSSLPVRDIEVMPAARIAEEVSRRFGRT